MKAEQGPPSGWRAYLAIVVLGVLGTGSYHSLLLIILAMTASFANPEEANTGRNGNFLGWVFLMFVVVGAPSFPLACLRIAGRLRGYSNFQGKSTSMAAFVAACLVGFVALAALLLALWPGVEWPGRVVMLALTALFALVLRTTAASVRRVGPS